MKKYSINIAHFYKKLLHLGVSLRGNKNIGVFAIFLALSMFFWFLNALRKEYTATISYPVRYQNIPSDKLLSGSPSSRLKITVRAEGFDLAPYFLWKSFFSHDLNVSDFNWMETERYTGAFQLTKYLQQNIASQFNNDIELVSIFPDTLFVRLKDKVKKEVPVKLDISTQYSKQFFQSGEIVINPATIEISGLAEVVDSVEYLSTEYREFTELKDTLVRNLTLLEREGVELSTERVVVTIPVEAFTEANVRVPIRTKGVPDSLRLKTFPGDVKITYRYAVSNHSRVNKDKFIAEVDMSDLKNDQLPEKLKVKILEVPEVVSDVVYSPIFVECLYEKVALDD